MTQQIATIPVVQKDKCASKSNDPDEQSIQTETKCQCEGVTFVSYVSTDLRRTAVCCVIENL
jgi:hypothetical protein